MLSRLSREFLEPEARYGQTLAALISDRVELARRPAVALRGAGQVAIPFQLREHRVERSRREAVAVTRQFFNHPLAIDWVLSCVMKNVQPNQTRQQVVMFHLFRQAVHPRETISIFDKLYQPDTVKLIGRVLAKRVRVH